MRLPEARREEYRAALVWVVNNKSLREEYLAALTIALGSARAMERPVESVVRPLRDILTGIAEKGLASLSDEELAALAMWPRRIKIVARFITAMKAQHRVGDVWDKQLPDERGNLRPREDEG